MKPFKVLTFNILGNWDRREGAVWNEREGAVARTISEADADLVGLQEAMFEQRSALDARLPLLARIPLDEHARPIIPHTNDPLNTILYRPSRFDLKACGTFWLGLDPARPSLDWEAAFPRCATWARLVDRVDGKPLLFVSTHFDHDSEAARLESAALILKFLSDARGGESEAAPVVIVGDFNTDASLGVHQQLIDGPPPLLDAWEETNGGPSAPYADGTFHDFTGEALAAVGRIDWILFSAPLTPLATDLLASDRGGLYPSDHFPVLSRFVRP